MKGELVTQWVSKWRNWVSSLLCRFLAASSSVCLTGRWVGKKLIELPRPPYFSSLYLRHFLCVSIHRPTDIMPRASDETTKRPLLTHIECPPILVLCACRPLLQSQLSAPAADSCTDKLGICSSTYFLLVLPISRKHSGCVYEVVRKEGRMGRYGGSEEDLHGSADFRGSERTERGNKQKGKRKRKSGEKKKCGGCGDLK